MKNGIKKLLAVLLSAALCLSAFAFLTACEPWDNGDESLPVVYSNGGTTVRYGDYVYFINGVPEYTDDSGETNRTGSVMKGGLYRAKIVDERPTLSAAESAEGNLTEDGRVDHNIKDDSQLKTVLDFEYEKLDYVDLGEYQIGDPDNNEDAQVLDENGNWVQNKVATNGEQSAYSIKVEQVISKKIGTSGYDGGFWIFDDIVYFASPDTDRDSEGNVQYERAEFYSYNLNTGSLTQLYTATEVNASVPYAFYKQNDNVYLVTFESYYANSEDEQDGITTGFIVCTTIHNGVRTGTEEIVSGVDSVYFPEKTTYDASTDKETGYDTVSDYIYFTRTASSSEKANGVILEMTDFAGNRQEITNNTVTDGAISITGVAGNYLYFTNTTADGRTRLEVTDCCAQRRQYVEDREGEDAANALTSDLGKLNPVLVEDTSSLTTIIPVDNSVESSGGSVSGDGEYSVAPCVIASTSDGFYRYESGNGDDVISVKIYNNEDGSATLLGYYSGRAYGLMEDTTTDEETGEETTTSSVFFSCSAYEHYSNRSLEVHAYGSTPVTDNFGIDFFSVTLDATADNGEKVTTTETYVSYFGAYTSTAQNYMYINKISGMFDDSSLYGVKLGYVPEYERTQIVCHDTDCIDWHHDHSSWENFGTDEEEGTDTGMGTDTGTTA